MLETPSMITKVLCSVLLLCFAYGSSFSAETKTTIIGNINFTIADGLTIERVADETLALVEKASGVRV